MKKTLKKLIAGATALFSFLATPIANAEEAFKMVWFPNESGVEMEGSRVAIAGYVEEALGRPVEHVTTTDYAIAIEAICNGQADLGFMGAQSYVEAHDRNDKVLPLVVTSGESGTLEDAVYYSWIVVPRENLDEYLVDGKPSIENIKGKRMSFVSNSSTSGFKIPTQSISNHFEADSITQDDLLEGGDDKFFSEVMFGGSHQGSAINLLTGKADVAAVCDTNMIDYVELVEGEANTSGAVYRVSEDAEAPFNNFVGKEFVLLASAPVLNEPFVINTENNDEETVQKLIEAFTSEEMNNDERIFKKPDSEGSALKEKVGDTQFVTAEDEWFNPIRELQ